MSVTFHRAEECVLNNFNLAIVAAATGMILASSASAECDVSRLVGNAVQISAVYDGFSPSDTTVPLLAPVPSDADCANKRIAYEFSSFDGRALTRDGFQLRSGSGTLSAEIIGDAAVNAVSREGKFEYSFNGASALSPSSLRLSFPRGQRVTSGLYEGQLRIAAIAIDENGAEQYRRDDIIAVSVRVPPNVSLSAAWGTELDLGELSANGRAREPLKFRAYANTRYEIILTSDNAFGLTKPLQNRSASISYIPMLSGVELSSGSDRMAGFETPPLTSGFTDHTLDVVVPELPLRPAGEYEDFITVTIRPALS